MSMLSTVTTQTERYHGLIAHDTILPEHQTSVVVPSVTLLLAQGLAGLLGDPGTLVTPVYVLCYSKNTRRT